MTPVECSRCTSDASFKVNDSTICYGCGFHTNINWHKDIIQNLEEFEFTMPELYKSLRYTDENGFYWYPQTINIPNKGMIFVDGDGPLSWKWRAVSAIKNPKKKTSQEYIMDMNNSELFDEKDFIEALDYIHYYEK